MNTKFKSTREWESLIEGKGYYDALHQLLDGDNRAWAQIDREETRENLDTVGVDSEWNEYIHHQQQ